MLVKTILNRVQKQPRFVYGGDRLMKTSKGMELHVSVRPRRGTDPLCSRCGQRRKAYDRLPVRHFDFVPLWAIPVRFVYAPRRADCPSCGVTVELMPWAIGKSGTTTTYAWFLASWAKSLSWSEVARRFGTTWAVVFGAVASAVEWGRANANYDGITAIGVDELAWKKGHKYLTVVYQLDRHCRRLLWIGRDRTTATIEGFFDWFGPTRTAGLRFVVSDMWRAFLGTVARRATAAVHVLDRFHVMKLANTAVDLVRRAEAHKLRAEGDRVTLKHTRWVLLRRRANLKHHQRGRLRKLLAANLGTARAYLLKEDLGQFWTYKSPTYAARYLDDWMWTAVRSRLAPMMKLAYTILDHRELLLNWFRARGELAMGATEGMNNKARTTMKIAYGFRSYDHAQIALFHRLGGLPEPPWLTHRFA